MTPAEFMGKYNLPSEALQDLNNLIVLETKGSLEDFRDGFLEGLAVTFGGDPVAQQILHRVLLAVVNPSIQYKEIPEA